MMWHSERGATFVYMLKNILLNSKTMNSANISNRLSTETESAHSELNFSYFAKDLRIVGLEVCERFVIKTIKVESSLSRKGPFYLPCINLQLRCFLSHFKSVVQNGLGDMCPNPDPLVPAWFIVKKQQNCGFCA